MAITVSRPSDRTANWPNGKVEYARLFKVAMAGETCQETEREAAKTKKRSYRLMVPARGTSGTRLVPPSAGRMCARRKANKTIVKHLILAADDDDEDDGGLQSSDVK